MDTETRHEVEKKPTPQPTREWERSEWFQRWLELIRQATGERQVH